MTHKWNDFVYGSDPWQPGAYFALGPIGESGTINEDIFAGRRKKTYCDAIKDFGVNDMESYNRRED